jgi:hypothetical protein
MRFCAIVNCATAAVGRHCKKHKRVFIRRLKLRAEKTRRVRRVRF